jgi:hypothetical protein
MDCFPLDRMYVVIAFLWCFWIWHFGQDLVGDKMLVVYGYRVPTARALLVVLYRFIIGRINNLSIQCESSNLFYSKLLDIFIVRCIRLQRRSESKIHPR